ncbi:MAG TPA: alpha,alpha-trehalose-phosphate synthase (UDP-forming) [Xanthobacteraceae bacterium]|nr:alpha,alpha-trehalose-phosphate synthase (UDP-forming) [Xanthobacteraceae bacterium]
MARLIVVSNRVSMPTRGAHRAGGLEVALQEVFKKYGGIWFGWSGRVVSPDAIETKTIDAGNRLNVVTDLTEEDYREYYNGFANRVLWPILHYRLDLAEYSRRDLSGYWRANEHFASELHKIIQPDDIVWVHDYHLIPLAKALRERGHQNKIGFFLHIPLPPPEILTALPNHEQLFSTLTHYNLVGFQTEIDSLNFARYLTHECKLASRDLRVFSAHGRTVVLGVFPVGVRTQELNEWAEKAMQSAIVRRVNDSLVGRTMLIGVDRLDYSKGIVQRMEAFERFLVANPGWRDKVTYLQITPKSRTKIQEYIEMERQVSSTAGHINGTHGDAAWTPIRYVNQSYGRSVLAGLYRSARVGLVTPLRDGMNLVAKEYLAAQDANDPGVLVLSRFAGAAQECKEALLVNPYDSESMANAIARALSMPLEERRERHKSMMRVLSENDIKFWGDKFITALELTYDEMTMFADMAPPLRQKTA